MNIQQAQEAIKQAKAENSTELNLSSFNFNTGFDKERLTLEDLIQLIPEIKQLIDLTTLDLSGNQISDIEALGQLSGLSELYLRGNQISDIEALGQLSGLTTLYLSGNQISDIEALGQLSGLTTLYLSGNQISDIEALGQLSGLTALDLSSNQISDIEVLGQLSGLTALDLSGNQISDIEVLGQLSGLSELYLRGNQISDIEALGQLSGLTALDLSSNQISDIEALGQLSGLSELYLRGNQISDIEALGQLSGLTTLYLSGNQISDIEALGQLSGLTALDLSGNQISDIEALGQLSGLTALDLSGNQISDIEALGQLSGLTTLDLSGNQISDIEALGQLSGLSELYLRGNQISDIEALGQLSGLTILYLSDNPKIKKLLPEEVIEDRFDPQRIINYYLKVKDGKPINEAKIVVVGEAEYGKTLLINRLVYGTYIPTERTHGIIITEWKNVEVNDEKVKLNIWDFGGQKIMQNTHQYFFTERTLYILVLNARQNEASNKTKEHLERIKTIAGDSPIIVVGNKIDTNKGEFDINRSELKDKFNIKGFFGVCSNQEEDKKGEYDINFAGFKEAVVEEISKLDGIHKPFREEWFEVKNYLESLKKKKQPFIKYHDYLKFCFEKHVSEAIDQTEIVTFLNQLGLVVYLQKKKDGISIEIGDKLIFNPEWLISGVYAVIDNPQKLKRRAILDFETFTEILDESKPEKYQYQPEDYKYILNMMLACKLCVKMKNSENDYLIPDHLKEDKSEVLQEYEAELGNLEFKINFQFKYTELFDDIFRRFLIAMYDDVYKTYYWKTGVVLTYDNCKALVTADNSENKIIIKIEGESAGKRKSFLAIIHKAFRDIYKTYPNLDYSEWIAHKDYPNILKSYSELISIEENIRNYEERKVYCEELKRFEHIDNFLDNVRIIERDKKSEEENRMSNGDTFNFYGNAQINKDHSTGHQHNYANNPEIEKKLDEMFDKLNENQLTEMNALIDALFQKIDDSRLRANKFSEEQIEEFNQAKYSSDTKAKIKWTYPLSGVIKELTGFSFEMEQEWKRSQEIKPEGLIAALKKVIPAHELQQTKFNEIEIAADQPKNLEG